MMAYKKSWVRESNPSLPLSTYHWLAPQKSDTAGGRITDLPTQQNLFFIYRLLLKTLRLGFSSFIDYID